MKFKSTLAENAMLEKLRKDQNLKYEEKVKELNKYKTKYLISKNRQKFNFLEISRF